MTTNDLPDMGDHEGIWWISTTEALTDNEFEHLRIVLKEITNKPVVLTPRRIDPMTRAERERYIEKLVTALEDVSDTSE